ncbi:MAG: hypothetical protein ACK5IC_09050, partial [Moheibacter sp.]
MKKLIIACAILQTIVSCAQKKETIEPQKKEVKMYKYLNNEKRLYGIGLNIPGPYELYINDIKASFNYRPSMHNTGVDINPYVLKSGTYSFRLKVFPMPSELEKGGVQPKTAEGISVRFTTAIKNDMGSVPRIKKDSYEVLEEYPIPKIDKPVPYVEITGNFTVDLPYELEGWSNSRVFAPEDSLWLKAKVVAEYEKLHNILNEGDADAFNELDKNRTWETYVFNYTPLDKRKEFEDESNTTIRERKGKTMPLEDYSLKIYGQGRLVCLERIHATEEINNW